MTYLEPHLRDTLYKPDTPVSWDLLPDHPGCNARPAEKQPKQRTTEEVAAECEAKQRAIEEKIHKLEDANNVWLKWMHLRIFKMMRWMKKIHVDLEGDNDDEVFDFGEVDAMADLSDVEEQWNQR